MSNPTQEVLDKYRELRREEANLSQKASELESDQQEFEVVLKTLEPMDASRKAYRRIGGVIVESKVGDVIPVVKMQKENITMTLKTIKDLLNKKMKEINEFQTEHNLTAQGSGESTAAGKGKSGGVLA